MAAYLVSVATQISIYLLLALGLNLHYGFGGLINFGQVAFYCIGAYASALLVLSGVPMPLGIFLGMLIAAVAAAPLGLLTLRLKAEYLAIITLGFAESIRLVALNETEITNGSAGLDGIPRAFIGWLPPFSSDIAYLAALVAIDILALLLVWRLLASPFGRLTRAVRDREEAVRALGKTPPIAKLKIFAIGGGLGGLAGALQAHYIGFLSPDQFGADVTFLGWMAIIIGGTGRIAGTVVGTALLIGFIEGTRFLHDLLPWISSATIAHLRLAAVGLGLILFLLYRPRGLVPERS
jgi:branched-chain amino acid transport system permease protein